MRLRISRGLLLPLALSFFSVLSAGDDKGIVSGVVNHLSAKRFSTVVYVEDIPGQKFTPLAAPAIMDQKGKAFLPHVIPILVGTTVEFLNSDSFEHNINSPDGEKYDLGKSQKGEKRSYTFKRPGVYTQLCNLHPEMIAFVLVLKTPYFATVDDTGKFQIPGVPPGTWKLKVWNERLKPVQLGKSFDVTVAAGQQAKIEVTF